MIIQKINVKNYKNLEDIEVINDRNIKYIIGENGIGKSNLLQALNSFFTRSSFVEDEFLDIEKPIEINLSLKLNEFELGYFDDFFDLEEENIINIRAIQESINDRIEYYHIESNSIISYQKIRSLTSVYYNSISAPEELNFIKTKTSGKFLSSLIERYIQSDTFEVESLINIEKVQNLSDYLNEILNLIQFVKDNKLSVVIEKNILELLPKLIELKNNDGISINKMGSGVKYSSYIYFEILNRIIQTVDKNSDSIIISGDKKFISLFIFLDEPEIHLHPFMQRSVINDMQKIIENKDEMFLKLIKVIFDLDEIFGQLIVVTHSPNIISNYYQEIIRLDKKKQKVISLSGSTFNLDKNLEKHFLLHILNIKEAFFARNAIICEGITERASIPYFAEKLGYNLDSIGIGIVVADGANTILPLNNLLMYFGMKTICIVDNDKYIENPNKFEGMDHTDNLFFEADLVEHLLKNNRIHKIYQIIKNYDENSLSDVIQKGSIEKNAKKFNFMNLDIKDYQVKAVLFDKEASYELKLVVFTSWFDVKKGAVLGKVIADTIDINDIPFIYTKIIRKAVKNNNAET